MAKKTGKDEETKKHGQAKKEDLTFNSLAEHATEPLFILSVLAFLVSMAFPFMVSAAVPAIAFPAVLGLAAAASVFFIYRYSNEGKGINKFIAVSLMIALGAIFSFWAQQNLDSNGDRARDYSTFAMFFGIVALFYIMWVHRLIKLRTAMIVALLFSSFIIHMTPAYSPPYAAWVGNYISDLDSYFLYKQAKAAVNTGYIPERETLAYPELPVSFDSEGRVKSVAGFETSPFGWPVLMASAETMVQQFGLDIKEVAILLPGILGAVTVLLLYLLIKEAFWEMKPYNYSAALLGAFMLMLNASYSSRAVATNCEDDTFGMLLLITTFLLFMMSLRRKNLFIGLLAGISMLFLASSWAGYSYAVMVFGLFAGMYAIVNFLNKKSAVDFAPYFLMVMIGGLLSPVILHAQGEMPQFTVSGIPFLLPFAGPVILAFVLESLNRLYLERGKALPEGRTRGEKLDASLRKNAPALTAALLLIAAFYLFFMSSPVKIISYVSDLAGGARQSEIIGMTTSEQRATCSDFNVECLVSLMGYFGLGVVFAVAMIGFFCASFLLFIASKLFGFKFDTPFTKSAGVLFMLAWSLPMLYGIVFRSQFMFNASAPIVAIGASIGLLFPLKKEDFQGLRVILLLFVVSLPLIIFLLQPRDLPENMRMLVVGPFGGPSALYGGEQAFERLKWEGALQYIAQLPKDSVILTWWDYGHWITAESDRVSILDNTKHQRFMVQDIARFHVLADSEEKALDIAGKYKSTQVVIDYTMISKSGAPYFIATSGLGEDIPLKRIGAKIECVNGTRCEELLEEDGDEYASIPIGGGAITIDLTTEYLINQTSIELPSEGVYQYKIEGSTDGGNWTTILDKTGGQFSGMQKDSFRDVMVRYLKIYGTYASTGDDLRIKTMSFYNPRLEGMHTGYLECQFSEEGSQIKPALDLNANNEPSMVSKLFFRCSDYMGLVFQIRDQSYSVDDVYVAVIDNNRIARTIPWKALMDQSGSSILGVQSFRTVIGNALSCPNCLRWPTMTSFIYVPGPKESPTDLNKVMMTRLYLGDYLEEYQQLGLADPDIEKPKYFSLVEEFRGDKLDRQDASFWGYVRIYNITYPQEP